MLPELTLLRYQFTKKEVQYATSSISKRPIPLDQNIVVIAQANEHSLKLMFRIIKKWKHLGVKKILLLDSLPQWTTDLPRITARQL